MPKHIGTHGHGPVIPPNDLNRLYGELRAQILSRHFALGRYFRADHLCFYNNLGVVHQSGNTGTNDVTQNDLVHQCLWADVLGSNYPLFGIGAEVVQPTTIYRSVPGLLALPKDEGLFERWRVGDHWRVNPLMYSGQLMVCLAVESFLGIPGSKEILARLLSTTNSLFKFSTAPYNGYILRWDPVTSDHWATIEGENGEIWTDHCCDFLTDSGTAGGYLYCTPLDDPRYMPYMAQSDFNGLNPQQMVQYQQARLLSLQQNRYWEPSQDELVGLLSGLSFVSQLVPDPDIQAQIKNQVNQIGAYLSANAYFLVRPGGGFSAQGGSDVCPALEFPFGRIFSRITGSTFSSATNFEGALQNAGLWSDFSAGFFAASVLGGAAGLILIVFILLTLPFGLSAIALILGAIVAAGGTIALAKAAVIWLNYESFDVYAWPGKHGIPNVQPSNNGEQLAFIGAYLLSQLPSKLRFSSWLRAAGIIGGGFAQNFPPFLGLSSFGDSDTTVRDAFLFWFNMRGGKTSAPAAFPPPPTPPQTALTEPINAVGQNQITVATSVGFGSPQFLISIGSELLTVTNMAGPNKTTWTVSRAQQGTTAAPSPVPAGTTVRGLPFDDGQSDFNNNVDPFATAVAVLLGAGTSRQQKLVSLLGDLAGEFASLRKDELALYFDTLNLNGDPYITEPIRPTMNFMAAMALAWFFNKTQAEAGNPLSPSLGFPTPPPAGTNLPSATIPGKVIENSFGFPTSAQVIPLSGLPPLANPIPDEVDLFSPLAPGKLPNPAPPFTSASWMYSVTKSHYGNWFGDSGTDTINAGQMLTGQGCVILGVKLILVDKHGAPLGGVATTTCLGRAAQEGGVNQWPSPIAIDGTWPFTAGARILSLGLNPSDEKVTIHWWYHTGVACRYQIAYLVQGGNCGL
jgi:hypothetical protein